MAGIIEASPRVKKLEAERDRYKEALKKVRRQSDTHPGWIRDTVDEALKLGDG